MTFFIGQNRKRSNIYALKVNYTNFL